MTICCVARILLSCFAATRRFAPRGWTVGEQYIQESDVSPANRVAASRRRRHPRGAARTPQAAGHQRAKLGSLPRRVVGPPSIPGAAAPVQPSPALRRGKHSTQLQRRCTVSPSPSRSSSPRPGPPRLLLQRARTSYGAPSATPPPAPRTRPSAARSRPAAAAA